MSPLNKYLLSGLKWDKKSSVTDKLAENINERFHTQEQINVETTMEQSSTKKRNKNSLISKYYSLNDGSVSTFLHPPGTKAAPKTMKMSP